MTDQPLLRTPLYDLHVELGGKMVPFAGYEMPVQFEGIMAEHNHTREGAGLFDVSHMGQARVTGEAGALEALITADLSELEPGTQKYTLLLNDEGGIMDDLMVSRPDEDGFFVVVNAATKGADFAHMRDRFGRRAELIELNDRALLALQGPKAGAVMEALCPDAARLVFMEAGRFTLNGADVFVSRSGYTGEDGFEISIPNHQAEEIARLLLDDERVKPIGLGARDSLRLEAGLCLYGHDMDETTTPIEASLTWAVAKSRRASADFPGARKILKQIEDGASRKRVGFKLKDKAPAREGAEIAHDGTVVGIATSGGFAPTAGAPIGMGYVPAELAKPGTEIELIVRGKARPAEIVKMPVVAHRFYRG
ncbi:glycine cleavage system aminomethyltransferase GcvT [Marinicauda sp. Alg238-R41]|uniref:glycine cleavage system aminomethyltransferase GcvT n=1 Tax=Marinicauda sp. Alg238-R41 TaxID=2993447 RepID=UPI0022DE99DE|nr:glycine cleavage system aminomethyltransferase GcvT [Marinicauda sp. Alg238-R41]